MNYTARPSIEQLRKDALEYYEKLATESHHWSSFVVKAIENYMPLDDEEYCYLKRKELLSKFTPEFIEKYWNKCPIFRQVMDALMNNTQPYEIIEVLIQDRINAQDTFANYVMRQPPEPIYLYTPPKSPTRWHRFVKRLKQLSADWFYDFG